jgi:putative transport protein
LAAAGQALRDHPPTADRAQRALSQALGSSAPPTAAATDPNAEANVAALQAELVKLPGMSYAVSYPGGVFGIISAMLLLRWWLGIDPVAEARELERQLAPQQPSLERLNIRLTNPNLEGVRIRNLPAIGPLQVFISRVLRGSDEFLAQPELELALGDVLAVVGRRENLEQFCRIVGSWSEVDPLKVPSPIQYRWVTVSRNAVVGVSMEELALGQRFGVQVTRVRRAETELPPLADMTLSLGDQVRVVGLPENIARVATELGDSVAQLGEPELVPVFVGIALGVLAGTLPLSLPGVPTMVKLGLAGGPLLLAILLSRIQRVGPLVWYLPPSASAMLKELGIAIFLASVGLKSGDRFLETFLHGSGMLWVLIGLVVTLVPLLITAAVARLVLRLPYAMIAGVLAGSMTDPPALAFAHSLTKSEIASVAYATVYPLSMMLRVITAQLLMLWWTGG